jgi:hypothetical protein
MMLVESITFVGLGNSSTCVNVRAADGHALVTINHQQHFTLTIDEIRALHSALGRILEGR